MRSHSMGLLALLVCIATNAACSANPHGSGAGKTLPAYDQVSWEAQLSRWRLAQEERRKQEARRRAESPPAPASASVPVPLLAPGTLSEPASASLDSVTVSGAIADSESITNVQTSGVDEGGIVKQHGRHLVVLRRGRLFTLEVGGDKLRAAASIDVFGPGIDPEGTWYDEMLIAGDTIAVIGYSYDRGGTEIGLFDIDAEGRLAYRDTYQLRASDYYSSRNYASRLIGQTLVFYSPLGLSPWELGSDSFYPALRHWRRGGGSDGKFERILPATRIHRSDDTLDPFKDSLTLHTVTRCDLSRRDMTCESTAVLGPESRVFYVSADSVFVWTTEYPDDDNAPARSSVFRIPLDGSAPTGLKTSGGPIDQLSFLQGADGYLNVLVTAESPGEGMWKAETREGDTALLRVPLSAFGDGSDAAQSWHYLPLPPISRYDPQNRYIGDWLIYGGDSETRWGRDSGDDDRSLVHALRYEQRDPAQSLVLAHAVERIEAMGADGVLVGNAGDDLHFTSLRLSERAATVSSFVQQDAAQGETRTHGFFYKRQRPDQGIVGLPVVRRTLEDMERYLEGSAGVLYLRNHALRLSGMGQLDAASNTGKNDDCRASCVDWYGNARPLFIGDRVFALLGYELVEGKMEGERIRELRRIDFTPGKRKHPSVAN